MIEASSLTKHYGSTIAVDGLSFTVPPGQVTGFLGPNGAGKSTTMRLILGLDSPDAGAVTVNGRPYQQYLRPLLQAGALLEARSFHGGRSAYHHLLCLAASNGISRNRVGEVLDLTGLDRAARRRAGGFSLGMGQRLGLAAALLGDPSVLILDEPVNGLDPEGVAWIRALLRSLAADGRTVLVSSHLMSEMENTADRLIIIGRGRLIAQAGMSELLAAGSGSYVKVRSPQAGQLAALLQASGAAITRHDDGALAVTGAAPGTIGEIARASGIALTELTVQQASLEERYMELTRDTADYHTAAPAAARK
ncbi:MAG TPA: ATP-binding cassette domain-containing protein [Streptosporangiaceae bacterium]